MVQRSNGCATSGHVGGDAVGGATKMKMPATAGILNYLANFQTREFNLQHFPYRENA